MVSYSSLKLTGLNLSTLNGETASMHYENGVLVDNETNQLVNTASVMDFEAVTFQMRSTAVVPGPEDSETLEPTDPALPTEPEPTEPFVPETTDPVEDEDDEDEEDEDDEDEEDEDDEDEKDEEDEDEDDDDDDDDDDDVEEEHKPAFGQNRYDRFRKWIGRLIGRWGR